MPLSHSPTDSSCKPSLPHRPQDLATLIGVMKAVLIFAVVLASCSLVPTAAAPSSSSLAFDDATLNAARHRHLRATTNTTEAAAVPRALQATEGGAPCFSLDVPLEWTSEEGELRVNGFPFHLKGISCTSAFRMGCFSPVTTFAGFDLFFQDSFYPHTHLFSLPFPPHVHTPTTSCRFWF